MPMTKFHCIVLACALAIPALAQDATTNAVTGSTKPVAAAHAPGQMFLASAAAVTAPLVFTNDYIHLESEMADVAAGGKAVFHFSITNAGDYQIESVVNAPDENANSFFVNMDAQPTDPDMVWDIEPTSGFEKRLVNGAVTGMRTTASLFPRRSSLGRATIRSSSSAVNRTCD